MQITDYALYTVPPRWQFLKLETDDGLVGWGEPYTKWHTLEDSEPATTAAIDQLMTKYVLGADPSRIGDLWEAMYERSFYRGGEIHMSAIAGIDQALWDLKGKVHGAPVHQLLGGPVRDRVRLYQHLDGATVDELTASAAAAVEEGFTAVKTSGAIDVHPAIGSPATTDALRERANAIRETVGNEVDIAIDLHGKVQRPMAKRAVATLEPVDPLFVEEPVTPEFNETLASIAGQTTVPIATGERMYTRMDFKPILEARSVDVVQPDVSHAGGITETVKIASLADAYDVALAPHCPMGPLSFLASLHVDAVAPNALIQEQVLFRDGVQWRDYVDWPTSLEPHEGWIDLPSEPGLGIDVHESRLVDQDGTPREWDRGIERLPDGSIVGS